MYTIYADGELLFSSAGKDDDRIILSPECAPDVNGAGSLSFVMPPNHALYDSIRKLKGIITVEQDGKIIFRGRAMEDEKDFFCQKNVYCEGDRSFFMDSQCAPYKFSGKALDLLQMRIDDHNSQVEPDKQFTLGRVTAITETETLNVENVAYWETWKEIDEKLLSVYGGYMMTRTEGGVTYLDWLKQPGTENEQAIEFSVNMLDLKDKMDAADVFTILIPLGASEMGEDGEYSPPVDITSVNNGLKYIVNEDAVKEFGKIWRTKTWNYEKSPQKLLERGREYLKTGIAVQTLTLKAVDMHFADDSQPSIHVGDYVHIVSNPHGLDLWMHCVKMEIDLLNPENTTYTFGEPPRTLSENIVKTEKDLGGLTGGGGGGRSITAELKDYIRWAEIHIDEDEAMIELLTGQAHSIDNRLSKAEITLDGVNAQIVLKADVETTNELGRRMSAAEIEIDGLNSEIVLKADKIDLQGYVTAEELEAAKAEISNAYLATISTNNLFALNFTFAGDNVSKSTVPVVTSFTQASGETATATDITFLATATGSATAHDVAAGETKTF